MCLNTCALRADPTIKLPVDLTLGRHLHFKSLEACLLNLTNENGSYACVRTAEFTQKLVIRVDAGFSQMRAKIVVKQAYMHHGSAQLSTNPGCSAYPGICGTTSPQWPRLDAEMHQWPNLFFRFSLS
jgi:hypothetical protein